MEFNLVIFLLNCVLVIGFLSAAAAYGLLFFKRTLENRDELVKVSRRILFLIITVQLIYFILRTLTYEHAPITSLFELTGLVAFGVTIAYRYIEFRTKVYETGFFVVAAAAVFQITSVVFISENSEVNPVLKSGLLGVHVSAALVGYSAIIISGIYGFLYLMLYKQLKQSRLNNFYKKLPSLQLLQQLTDSAIQFGFFFLTLTVLIGIVWLPKAIKDFSFTDPKLISTFIVWFLYALGFAGTRMLKMKSRTMMRLAIFGFVFTVFSLLVVNLFTNSFHRFL